MRPRKVPKLFIFNVMSILKQFNRYARLFKYLQREFIRIANSVDNAPNTGVDDHLRANNAWLVRTIHGSPINRNTQFCSLDDSVLLSVNRIAKLVTGTGCDAQRAPHAFTFLNAA